MRFGVCHGEGGGIPFRVLRSYTVECGFIIRRALLAEELQVAVTPELYAVPLDAEDKS